SCPATLRVVRDVEFAVADEQNCWWGIELNSIQALKLANGLSPDVDDSIELPLQAVRTPEYLRAACLEIAVLSTHQQGRDTHIRQVRVYGPIEDSDEGEFVSSGGWTRPSNASTSNAAFVFALGTEAADTPQQQTRAREGVSFARAWSQDFFAALTGTQPPNP
ncbi:anaphase-promoting complex subunit 10 domain-containing protein, putative, partial [Eimeria acervulina]